MPRNGTKLLVLLCVSVPSFMINLDANIVAVSLSAIAQSLKADFAAIEWVISAYTLTFASFLLPAGALADRYGRKLCLVLGLGLFTLASLACGVASDAGVLNAARAAQGIGAAFQLSAALAILSHEFRGPERGRAFSFWGSVIGVAITLGPVLGGLITQHLGWRWAFYVNIPVGVALIGLIWFTIEDSKDPDATRLDVAGFLSFAGGLFLVTLALISGNGDGWGDRRILAEFAGSALLFGVFLAAERMQRRPMVDLSFFRRPTYLGAITSTLGLSAGLLTILTYLPIFFQRGLGYAPASAGLLMLPMAIPLFAVPRIVAGHLAHRYSGRALLTAGLVLIAAGLLWMAASIGAYSYLALLGGMLVAGCGADILNGESAKVSMTVIPPERAGMASGIGGTVRFTGIVVGFATLGAVLYARIAQLVPADMVRRVAAGELAGPAHELARASFASGYQALLLAAATIAAIAALISWLLVRPAETAPQTRAPAAAPATGTPR